MVKESYNNSDTSIDIIWTIIVFLYTVGNYMCCRLMLCDKILKFWMSVGGSNAFMMIQLQTWFNLNDNIAN
jgi:hypothetical protein